MNERFKILYGIIPFCIGVICCYLFYHLFEKSENDYVDFIFQNKRIEIVTLIDKLNSQRERYENWNDEIGDEILINFISQMDKGPGILSVVMDITLTEIKSARSSDKYGAIDLFDPQYNDLFTTVKETSTGQKVMDLDVDNVKVFWVTYPKANSKYYIILVVSPKVLSSISDFDILQYFFYIIVAILVGMTYTIVYGVKEEKTHQIVERE
jgi:hypothetical protein